MSIVSGVHMISAADVLSLLSIQVKPVIIVKLEVEPNVSFVRQILDDEVDLSCSFRCFLICAPVL